VENIIWYLLGLHKLQFYRDSRGTYKNGTADSIPD